MTLKEGGGYSRGEEGKVVMVEDDLLHGIAFDNWSRHRHDLDGSIELGYGYYVDEEDLLVLRALEKEKLDDILGV